MSDAGLLARPGGTWSGDAFVVACLFDAAGGRAAFALGDGTLRQVEGRSGEPAVATAHDGAVLALAPDAGKRGFLTGGDDGRLVRVDAEGAVSEIARHAGRWIEQVASNAEAGLIAYGVGKQAHLIDAKGAPRAVREHPSTVAGLAFNPKGRRFVSAHYGGVSLWWAQSKDATPKTLEWKGSHVLVSWSPDGNYIVTGTQENDLHGWRMTDGADMRMSGYPAKVKSISWVARGQFLATSGAEAIICWPFTGDGPMGKPPIEFALSPSAALVTQVAGHPARDSVAAGFADGAIRLGHVGSRRSEALRRPSGTPISALALSPKGDKLAFGDEAGNYGVIETGL
jgi:WD40 repeat protein